MDPIRNRSVSDTTPVTPTETSEATKTDKKFDIGGPGAASAAGQPTVVGRPNFDRISSKIQDGVGRSLTRDQVRDEVIENETKSIFGDHATPKMTAAVTDAFKNDPHLSSLFSRLYNQATAK